LDGKRCAFVGCMSPLTVSEQYEVVVDGKAIGKYHDVTSGPIFAPDGAHVHYGASRVMGPLYDSRGIYNPHFQSSEYRDGKVKEETGYGMAQMIYSADGNHVVRYWTEYASSGDAFVPARMPVVDVDDEDQRLNLQPLNLTVTMRQYSSKIASIASNYNFGGGYCMHVNGRDQDRTQIGPPHTRLGPPLFSPDSCQLAYAAQDDPNTDWFVVLDQAEDTRALIYPTVDVGKDGKWNPITQFVNQTSIDNGCSYPGQLPYHFDADGTLVYFRVSDGHLYRVHWKPEDATTAPATRP
jgi:hypothetical protein